ncbi:MAG: hypothetical protein AAGL49_08320 [Pseudomonadota bacterium]
MPKFKLALAAAALGLVSAPAFAGEAMDKCVAFVTEQAVADGEAGCVCFSEGVEADAGLLEEYLSVDLSDWEGAASDGLKALAEQCFPNA